MAVLADSIRRFEVRGIKFHYTLWVSSSCHGFPRYSDATCKNNSPQSCSPCLTLGDALPLG